MCLVFRLFFVLAVFLAATPAHSETAAAPSMPFMREANLLIGSAHSGGDGLKTSVEPLVGFIYFRAFTPPQPGKFVLRMLADALLTQITPSDLPLADLAPGEKARAALVRFGFSGCWVPDALWLLCMDDGPRVTWLNQGTQNAQVLGSFPLGLSVHSGHAHPVSLHARAEFSWWKSVRMNTHKRSTLNMFWMGAGYSW